ncbi:siderophore-interacting protein [Kineosporia sp. NBRC 101731]|uniref:siderophore-interacting protein n=1 Tax=Kineosporia sp. NBRC 101731 TaxID=3032199 RepID=UPI0024A5DADB|nr:siderophore-interacting protein [Kineosporia sp. NBRC 101731]GLY32205.1 siderophore-interacting protein [Kineosporia sp. NBRC 101731]
MKHRLLERLLLSVRVQAVEPVAPRLRRVTLAGPDLSGLSWVAGQHVRLQVADGPTGLDWVLGTLRTYTVWNLDAQGLDLVVFDHGDGPGARWARTVRPGEEVMLLKPQGTFTIRPAAYHLFAGEETAQASFGPMLAALPEDAPVFVRLEVDTPAEHLDLPRRADVGWSYRQGRPAASSETLVQAVRDLDLPAEPGIAYLAGEARTIQMIRRHLVEERSWPRRNVLTKPYWAPGRKGLD